VKFVCDRLEWKGEALGSLQVELNQRGSQMTIDKLILKAPQFDFLLSKGISTYGSKASTTVQGRALIRGYHKRMKESASLKSLKLSDGIVLLDAWWMGGLQDFALPALTGIIKGRIGAGRFMGVNSAFERVLNLMSLNLSDMADRTIRFDDLYFRWRLEKGVWSTKATQAFFGSTFIHVSGQTLLGDHSLSLEASLTPWTGESDDDAAGSGVPVGPEGYDRMIDEGLKRETPSNILSHTYKIGGTWEKPQYDF
jgi:uncharacterized protein YhdP